MIEYTASIIDIDSPIIRPIPNKPPTKAITPPTNSPAPAGEPIADKPPPLNTPPKPEVMIEIKALIAANTIAIDATKRTNGGAFVAPVEPATEIATDGIFTVAVLLLTAQPFLSNDVRSI